MPTLHPTAGRGLIGVVSLLALTALAGCTPDQPLTPPAPTVTVTLTPPATPTEHPTNESTRSASEDAAARSAGEQTRDADVRRWRLVADLLDSSDAAGKPVQARFSAVIRDVSYSADAASEHSVELTFDRVEWNPEYSDGGDQDIVLNPRVEWETLRSGDLLVLVNPGDGPHQVPMADFPTYVQIVADQSRQLDGWITPFTVYYVGDEPVALIEWYVP